MSTITRVYLKKGKEQSVERFHPWIFSGAINYLDNETQEGELVKVYSNDNTFLGIGHFQIGSIAVRILSFEDIEINHDFWVERLTHAVNVRKSLNLFNQTNNVCRLVHGEGDNLPGLIVDFYNATAVMQCHSVGMYLERENIAKALKEVMGEQLKAVYDKSEGVLPYKADIDPVNEYLIGNSDTEIAIENGLKFHVDWLKGQKTGFFVDQRENRSLLEFYSKDRAVLNMFCYTGGFSFYAMRGGAKLVHSVDSSSKAIDITNKNVELNFPDDNRHKAFDVDAFKFLDESKDKYDLIVLDPPAFAKHRKVLRNALQGYKKLNVKGFEQIKKGGIMFTFSCSQAVTRDDFRRAVFTAAAIAKRKVRILHQLSQPADHPINIYHPEGEYLKGLVLYVE